ncbi:MAG: 6,7-dimethyl-8-ribityllumazine synthase [Acidobacteria bacterium]|nr:6,7-dimethyl-8-ribityllumazine synthase [Acidobacteriota bacterium]
MQTERNRTDKSGRGFRFAIIVSSWHDSLTAKLQSGATSALKSLDVVESAVEIFRAPGAFELPLASLWAARSGRFDAVIALGVVIRGETPHFDYVAGEAARGIGQASLETGIPILFGVVTADTLEQAEDRCGGKVGNKGHEVAIAAVEMANLFREMSSSKLEDKVFLHVV